MRGLAAPLIKLLIFVAITVTATGMLAFTIASTDFSSASEYQARFADVAQLNTGDDVRIAGVKVGRIRKIEIADRHLAQVTFSVDQDVTLPAGTIATIRFRNLVGQRYLTLDRGTGDPTAVLKPGATLPLEQTRPALDLTALFNGFKPLFQALSPNDVNQLSYEIIQVLQGEGGTVDSLLSHTARLTSTIASRDQVIGQLVDNLNSVLGTLNSRTPQLSSTIVTVQQLVSGLAQDRKPIGDAITAIGQLANTTSGFLAAGRAPLKDSIAQLGALTANLNRNQPTVEHFIQNLGPKLSKLIPTAQYGSWFNFFLCQADGSIGVPGLITTPVSIPLQPATQARCSS